MDLRTCGRQERANHKQEIERRCEIYDEGPFMAQCGMWHRMEKNISSMQNGENEGCDELNEAKMLYKEDKRAHRIREEKFGAFGNAQKKIRFLEQGQVTQQNKVRVRSESPITSDEDEQHDVLARVTYLEQENGNKKEINLRLTEGVKRHPTQLAQTFGTDTFLRQRRN